VLVCIVKLLLSHVVFFDMHVCSLYHHSTGLSVDLAYQVAVQFTEHDVIAAHARDEVSPSCL
jgi:hypothetical protein